MSKFLYFIQNITSFLTNLFLWICIVLIYLVPLSIGFVFRYGINYFVTRSNAKLVPLSPNDILLIREDYIKQPIVNGGFILKVKGHLDYEELFNHFNQLFLSDAANQEDYENLYCDIVKRCGYLFKRRLYSAPANSTCWRSHFVHNQVQNFSDIKRELSAWFQTKYEERRPLWQIILVTCANNSNNSESWVGFKCHHGLMDGYSIVHVLNKLCGVMPVANNIKQLSKYQEAKLLFTLPTVGLKYLFRNFWSPDHLPTIDKLTELRAPMPLGLASVNLQILKLIRRKLNVHFPSIVYALQIGTLRRALVDHFQNDNEKKVDLILSEITFLSTSFPVANHPRSKLTNHWSGGTVRIPMRDCGAVNRVKEADYSFRQMTGDEGPYLVWKYLAYLPWLIPAAVNYRMALTNLSLFRYRTSMSCIPQEQIQYCLLGRQVINVFHAPIMKDAFPQALMLGCSSTHKGQVDFSLFGHPDLFPDQDAMNRLMSVHFKAEIEQLVQQCELPLSDIYLLD